MGQGYLQVNYSYKLSGLWVSLVLYQYIMSEAPEKQKQVESKEVENKEETKPVPQSLQKAESQAESAPKQPQVTQPQVKIEKTVKPAENKPRQKQKPKQKKKEVESKSLPLKVVLFKNNQPIHFQFPSKIHNFNLTNTIFNFDDESEYKLSAGFSEIQHLELLRTFLEKHNYQPSSIRIAKPLVSDKMKDNVDSITYELLAKYQLDQNFEEAAMILELAEYIGIAEFKDAMYAAVGSPFMIPDTDEAIEEYKNRNGLTDLTVEQEDQIIKQFPSIFQKINKDLLEGIGKEIDFSPSILPNPT